MSALDLGKVFAYFAVLLALAAPLGRWMARVYEGSPTALARVLGPLERLAYRFAGVPAEEVAQEQSASRYATSLLVFNALGFLVLVALQRLQASLPLNPAGFPAPSWHLSLNTAVSFVTNTNWQAYGGESTYGYLVQMAGLGVQNFVSAGTGMAVLVALVRGFRRTRSETIGNFWVDLTRSTLYVLLPLSVVLAVVLVSQGVVQTFAPYPTAELVEPFAAADGTRVAEQVLALGPAASQVAIKQLGTNGGGFFNANSAHPFENPTPLSNLLECLAILLIPAALCFTYGALVKDRRQGWTVLGAMLAFAVPLTILCVWLEARGTPVLTAAGLDPQLPAPGSFEGKEVRFGVAESGLWATWTTAASNGSVNAMHDSFTPLGGIVPLFLMQLGEVVFGGVGSGLYGMLVFAIIAVFIAGLMVGRTPEFLGKKIEAAEMKMASLVVLLPAATVLLGTAAGVATEAGRAGIFNPGPHGFTEVLYAFTSAGNNNGSAFGGLGANAPFYNLALALAMVVGRYGVLLPVLALAGSLARKKVVPPGAGTLPTHGPLFASLLVGVVFIVGALTFVPALALGPVVEHLQLHP